MLQNLSDTNLDSNLKLRADILIDVKKRLDEIPLDAWGFTDSGGPFLNGKPTATIRLQASESKYIRHDDPNNKFEVTDPYGDEPEFNIVFDVKNTSETVHLFPGLALIEKYNLEGWLENNATTAGITGEDVNILYRELRKRISEFYRNQGVSSESEINLEKESF